MQDSVSMVEERPIMRNTYIATLKNFYKEYTVSFEVMPISIYQGWVSVIHLAPEGEFHKNLDTLPVLYLIPSGEGTLFLSSLIESFIDKTFLYKNVISLTQWSTIKMIQSFIDGSYVYSIYANDIIIYSAKNSNPAVLSNVVIYASDPWSIAQNGFIRNLAIRSENSGNIFNLIFFFL